MNGATNGHDIPADAGDARVAHADPRAVGDDPVRDPAAVRDGHRVVAAAQHVRLPGPAASEAIALIGMIERAAADPSVDLDRIERMYAMYERATARSAKSAYLQALARARAEIPVMAKRGEISTNEKDARGNKTGNKLKQSKFVKWEEAVEIILPILQKNDLVLTFSTEQPGLDRVSVTAILSHIDGHSERAQMALPIENGGSKNNAQGWGSSVSYGKRYTAFALLNLVGRDEDNDGAGAMLDDEQQATMMQKISEVGADVSAFLETLGFPSVSDIPATSYQTAMNLLNAKARRANGSGK